MVHFVSKTGRALLLAACMVMIGVSAHAQTGGTVSDAPAAQPGQSVTQLASGQLLLLGGFTGAGTGAVSAQAVLLDATLQNKQVLAQGLNVPRAGQSATALPDGTVLIVGGVSASGQPTADVERYHPDTQQFEDLGDIGLAARSGQSAVLLSNGQLLFVGGADVSSLVHADSELLDTVSLQVLGASGSLAQARSGQQAQLLPNGEVLVWAGQNQAGQSLSSAELYDPGTGQFSAVDAATAAGWIDPNYEAIAPAITSSIPPAGGEGVAVNARLSVRFSEPLQAAELNAQTVTLIGPGGAVQTTVAATDGGLLVFVTPQQQLLPGSGYTLFVQSVQDTLNRVVPFTAIGFQTASLSTATSTTASSARTKIASATPLLNKTATSNLDGLMWTPTPNNMTGLWRSGQAGSAQQSPAHRSSVAQALHEVFTGKSLPNAPAGVTALAGQVLLPNGQPLANVTLSIGTKSVTTDANGEFLLASVGAGAQTLVIDGGSAGQGDVHYGRYEYLATLVAGKTTALPFVIWMTALDLEHAVNIASPTTTETVVTNPLIPGLELRIPAGTVIRDSQGHIVTQLTITPIPVDQPPFPLPNHWVTTYFTIQPGGATLQGLNAQSAVGAQLVYPNFGHAAPGTRIAFWNYDPLEKGWYIYGYGTVSTDGTQVVPDPGVVIYQFTGAMVASPTLVPIPPKDCDEADPVDCFTGLFLQDNADLHVNDVLPIDVHRVYRTNDSTSRAFGIGTNLSYDMFIVGDINPYTYIDLILPDGGQVHYTRTSAPGYVYTTTDPGPYHVMDRMQGI